MNELKQSPTNLSCRICEESKLYPFLDLGRMPIANAFLSNEQISQSEYTFRLQAGFCDSCTMVQLVETVDPNMLFHDHYAYFSSISSFMDDHFTGLAVTIGKDILYDDHLPVVEIGTNDGILLQKLAGFTPNAIGIEPSANVAAAARKKGLSPQDLILPEWRKCFLP